jgi:hypothetical protein
MTPADGEERSEVAECTKRERIGVAIRGFGMPGVAELRARVGANAADAEESTAFARRTRRLARALATGWDGSGLISGRSKSSRTRWHRTI